MQYRSLAVFRRFFFVLFCLGTALGISQSAQAAADVPGPAMHGAWTVVQAANPADIGLRFFFSPDGVFLMVNPHQQLGASGSWVYGRGGLMISLFNYGRSSEFISGEATVQGDRMIIDVKRSGVIASQQVWLQRMRLQ